MTTTRITSAQIRDLNATVSALAIEAVEDVAPPLISAFVQDYDTKSGVKYFTSKSAAETAAANYVNNTVVIVTKDSSSTPPGARVRYVVVAGALTSPTLDSVANEQADTSINFYKEAGSVPVSISTANNLIVGTALPATNLVVNKSITGGTNAHGSLIQGTIQGDVTSLAAGVTTALATANTPFTIQSVYHFQALQGTFGAGSTVNYQTGFLAQDSLTGAIFNYGFFGNIPNGSNRWNFYAQGTAGNFFAGVTHQGQVNPQIGDTSGVSVANTSVTGIETSVASTTATDTAHVTLVKYSSGSFDVSATTSNQETGRINFAGYNATTRVSSANVIGKVGNTWSAGNTSQYVYLTSTGEGSTTLIEGVRVHGPAWVKYQATPTDFAASTTLTAANITNKLVTKSGTATVTLTLPTGIVSEGITTSMSTDSAVDWSVINTNATGAVTLAASAGHTTVGSMTVATNTSGSFRTRKTAANTFVTYRL